MALDLKENDGKAELELDAAFVVPPGSQLRASVEAARKKGTLKLRVVAEGVVKGKRSKELGAGEFDLSVQVWHLPESPPHMAFHDLP